MTRLNKMPSLKHLGSFRGEGGLSIGKGEPSLGSVRYEIDCYLDRAAQSANGQVEGEIAILEQAFQAGAAFIALVDGTSIDVVLSDPKGGPTAEIAVCGRFPV